MDKMEGEFLEKRNYKPFTWLRYIDGIFFIWTDGENKLKTFLENVNQFHPSTKFTHESVAESVPFLDLCVKLSQNLKPIYMKILQANTNIFTIFPTILDIPSDQ